MSAPEMSGPEHYREAGRLIEQAHKEQAENGPGCGSEEILTEAQVHATLALAAATAYPTARDEDTPTARKWCKWVDVGVS